MSSHRRSFSQLQQYTDCSMRFYLSRIATPRPPARPAPWFILGNALHEVYDAWERAGRTGPTMVEMFPGAYDRITEEYKVEQPDLNLWVWRPNVKNVVQDIKLTRENGIKQVTVFQEHCDAADWKIWELPDGEKAIEVSFQIKLGEVVVRGGVDQILEWPDGRLTIRDLKTGNKKDDTRQLGLYRVAAEELFGESIVDGEFWYTKTGNSGGWVDLRRYTKDYMTEQFARLDRGIEAGVFLVRPGDNCNLCDVYDSCPERGNPSAETARVVESDTPPF